MTDTQNQHPSRMESVNSGETSSLSFDVRGPIGRSVHLVLREEVYRNYGKRSEMSVVEYGIAETPFGCCNIAFSEFGICSLVFIDGDNAVKAARELENCRSSVRNDIRAQQMVDIFLGKSHDTCSEVHIDVRGTAFQVEVWKALLSVGFGTTMSYQEVATSIGLPKAVRAVANAVGDNPVSLFIPCHRIVKSDGSLGGYLWGVAKKQSILDWENAHR